MNSSSVIETSGLRKTFGGKVAVADLTLRVERGEVFGFLGPNGAGKTTSIKMLLGLTRPTGGAGRLLGAPIGDHAVRSRVGFLPENFRFHDWLTAEEFLRVHGRLYGMHPAERERRIPALLERVGLAEHAAKPLRAFSKGMKQRVGLAMAMLNQPEVIFLDEPTSGLDPVGRRMVRDVIHELREHSTAVFLNSHLLSEVEITCDRVAFVKNGVVVRQASLQSLVAGSTTVELRVDRATPELTGALARLGREVQAEPGGERISLSVDGDDALPAIARLIVEQDRALYAMTPQHISLEDLFLQIVGAEGSL
ncbi:MAG TPA: ABC transporter ATP-binding protein [Anaerolineae bacterium]|nr:ABC transporter ATP-binding protein [Anaerolineae bacterium]